MGAECDGCGLAECDLPDGVEPGEAFTTRDGATLCAGCAQLPASARPSGWC